MFKRLKDHLRDNSGDVYIQMLICTLILLLISVIIISVASSINTKLWLEEQLNDIVRVVENNGSTETPAGEAIEQAIIDRLGGTITYEGRFINDNNDNKGLVQLNDTVMVKYHCDKYTALKIIGIEISTPVNISKPATSNVYYKLEETLID